MKRERYIIEILRSLDRHGGTAPIASVYQDVLDALRSEFTAWDTSPVSSGAERTWRNEMRQARRSMIDHGLMKKMRSRGTWEVDRLGREYLKAYPHVKLHQGSTKGMSWAGEVV